MATTTSTSPSSSAESGPDPPGVIRLALGPAQLVFTSRHGGGSSGPYATANLSYRVGDDPSTVAANHAQLAARLGPAFAGEWWLLDQRHGANVIDIDSMARSLRAGVPGPAFWSRSLLAGIPGSRALAARASSSRARRRSSLSRRAPAPGDAAVTTEPGACMVVLSADCAPIALANDDALGVVHAGWAGMLAGVVEAAAARLREVGHGALRAVLGPCIRPARYPFSPEDLEPLVARYGAGVQAVTDTGAPALDLPAAIEIALARCGVDALYDTGVCTASSPDHFSHRRDGRDGNTGRQALVAVLDP